MGQQFNKKTIEDLMKIKGEVRGVTFKTDAEFVLKEKGKDGLKKVQEELKNIGHPIDYDKLGTMDFYPVGLRILSLLVIQKVFNFSKKDIKRMGSEAPKKSLIIKLFMKHFLSLAKTAEYASKMWEKHYTIGLLEVDEHEKEKWAVVRIKDFAVHPAYCRLVEGYFSTVVQMSLGFPVNSKEIKCVFKGDKYHEFLFTW